MKRNLLHFFPALLCTLSLQSFAGEAVSAKQPAISPTIPAEDPWEVTLGMPMWAAGLDGTTGVRGYTAATSVDFIDILNNLDMTAALSLEVRKGRWGGWLDGLYLKASVGADTPGPLLTSLNVGVEQIIAEAAIFYRAWQSDRGFLDIYGGVRYMSVSGELGFNVSNNGVEQVSQQLSEKVIDQVVSAVKSQADAALSGAKSKIASQITTAARATVASAVSEKVTTVKTAIDQVQEIAAAYPRLVEVLRKSSRLKTAIQNVAQAEIDQKLADAQVAAATAQNAAAAAQAAAQSAAAAAQSAAKKAVSKAEKKLAGEIEEALRDAIPNEISQSIDWVDPFIGLRASYDLTDRLYAVAKADIGGFGVSSDLVWSAYGALGYRVTKSGKTTLELGYKHLDVDYSHGGFTFDVAMSGVMLNLGMKF